MWYIGREPMKTPEKTMAFVWLLFVGNCTTFSCPGKVRLQRNLGTTALTKDIDLKDIILG